MSTALFILGMHRSGTSALTRVVNLLGAELSDKLMKPQADNERGFWEQDEVVPAHEALLLACHAQWCDPFFLPKNFEELPAVTHYVQRLTDIVNTRFSNSPLWALKDPRTSILLPVWKPILKHLSIKPVYLIALRHPLEVAKSLEKRDQMEPAHGCALWLHYTLKSLEHSDGDTRLLISYDSLLHDWKNVAANIERVMGSSWPRGIDAAAPEVDSYLSKDLRHHALNISEKTGDYFIDTANELYQLLAPYDGKDPEYTDAMKAIAKAFDTRTAMFKFSSRHACRLLHIAQEKLLTQHERCGQLESALLGLKHQVEALMRDHAEAWEKVRKEEAQIHELHEKLVKQDEYIRHVNSSLSLKLTAPFRAMGRLFQKAEK